MNQIHPQDDAFLLKNKRKEKKRIHPVNGVHQSDRPPFVLGIFFPRVRETVDAGWPRRWSSPSQRRRRSTGWQGWTSESSQQMIPPLADLYRPRPPFAGYIYTKLQLVMRPWKRMGTRSMRDTGHSLHPCSKRHTNSNSLDRVTSYRLDALDRDV